MPTFVLEHYAAALTSAASALVAVFAWLWLQAWA